MREFFVSSGIVDLISQSDALVLGILITLLLVSIWCWSIALDKMRKFKLLETRNRSFEKLFWSGQMLEELYKKVKNKANNPAAVIFCAAMQEWEMSNVLSIAKDDYDRKNALKARLEDVMYVALNRSVSKFRYGLGFMGIAASASPFVGLFGTVWGILLSFQAMAASKDAGISAIAPGMAGALLTTVAGLIVAIPAVIFFNHYNNKVNDFSEKMENFIAELLTILSRELDR